MQPAKLSKICLIVVLITWCCCCASSVEAQQLKREFSSRIGYSQRPAANVARIVVEDVGEVGSNASQSIQVDRNLGRSGQTSFTIQEEDDVDSSDREQADSATQSNESEYLSDSDSEQSADESEGASQSESNQLDFEEDEEDLDLDELDPDVLDPEFDEDRRPQRPMFGAWPRKGIRGIGIDIRETNVNVPEDVSHQLISSNRSNWTQFHPNHKVFAWAAPDIRYQPLYFEDVALERYGQTAGPHIQCYISAVNFFADFVLLPHQMRHDCPGSCDHPLGFCRPGNTTPYSIQRHYFGRPGR